MPNTELRKEYDAIVIGGGLAGAFTILEISAAHPEWHILLIEAGTSILSDRSTSSNQCFKLHTGLHYPDLETSEKCLKKSIAFLKKVPPSVILGNPSDPWRRGTFFVVSNSMLKPDKVIETAEKLKEVYREEVAKDPSNKVFGEPEEFYKVLSSREKDFPYVNESITFTDQENNTSQISVVLAIETRESQINFTAFKEYLENEFAKRKNVTILTNHKVTHASQVAGGLHHQVFTTSVHNDQEEQQSFTGKVITNCTWENIEQINKSIGFYVPSSNSDIIIRAKLSTLVELPDALKNINTCIFSTGPHTSVTNLGDGTAIITHEPSTNVGCIRAGEKIADPEMRKIFNDRLDLGSDEGEKIASNILKGAANYIPGIEGASKKKLRTGFVRIYRKENHTDSIYEKDSAIHLRREDGIEVNQLGFISFAGMKGNYTAACAEEVSTKVSEHHAKLEFLEQEMVKIKTRIMGHIQQDKNAKFDRKIFSDEFLNILLGNVFKEIILEQYKDIKVEAQDKQSLDTSHHIANTAATTYAAVMRKLAVNQEFREELSKNVNKEDKKPITCQRSSCLDPVDDFLAREPESLDTLTTSSLSGSTPSSLSLTSNDSSLDSNSSSDYYSSDDDEVNWDINQCTPPSPTKPTTPPSPIGKDLVGAFSMFAHNDEFTSSPPTCALKEDPTTTRLTSTHSRRWY